MEEKQFKKISEDLDSIKKLLILLLKKYEVKGDSIAMALGISEGRLSQILPQKKYNRVKKND
jgi:DNA-directed RNA polymerase specialized sigma subunit